jgi:CRP/FNR family transcriptional regulator, cyclic AMP receptor protein
VTDADLSRFSVFAALGEPELQLVAFLLETRELGPDERIWQEGEPGNGLWLLEHGALRFESRGEGALGQCEAPACFGAASLVGDSPREVSAYTAAPARVLVMSRTAFAQLLEAAPRTAAHVLAAIAAELGAVMREGIAFSASRR